MDHILTSPSNLSKNGFIVTLPLQSGLFLKGLQKVSTFPDDSRTLKFWQVDECEESIRIDQSIHPPAHDVRHSVSCFLRFWKGPGLKQTPRDLLLRFFSRGIFLQGLQELKLSSTVIILQESSPQLPDAYRIFLLKESTATKTYVVV